MTDIKAKTEEATPGVISIILPTRGRVDGALQASLKSLLDTASTLNAMKPDFLD